MQPYLYTVVEKEKLHEMLEAFSPPPEPDPPPDWEVDR